MQIDLLEIFSEIVTGVTCAVFLIISCCLYGIISVEQILPYVEKYSSFTNLLGISVVIYAIGLMIDGIGLGIGDWFLDGLVSREKPNRTRRSKYIKNVSNHAFEYRNRQWAYYSSYRNLFLLIIPFGICLINLFWWQKGLLFGIVSILIFFLLEVIIFKTMKMLLNLYYSLEDDPG